MYGGSIGPDNNIFPGQNLYGTYGGSSLGVGASAYSLNTAGYADSSAVPGAGGQALDVGGNNTEVQQAAAVGASGKPLMAWFGLAVGLVVLMLVSKKFIKNESFAHLEPSVYNILVIGWAAILGISFWKMVFVKIKVPGLTSVVLAS